MPTSPTLLLLTAPGNDDNRKIDSGWRAATPAETSTAITRCCAAHCTAALLAPAALATEHTRYVRFVQDRYGVLVDAFSGAALDLMTQSATLQYKTETERRELLGATAGAGTDFEDVADAVLERQRKGSAVAEIRSGGVDGSRLLQDVLHAGVGWEQGCYTGQPCALVLGPAASGKTTLLRRFAVEAVQLPGHFVPIFVTVIDLVRWAADACRSDDVPTRALELFEATIAQAAAAPPAAPLRARFLAQALAERRVLFLVDGMDEAGEQAELVETMLARHVVGGGHRLIATTRRSGLSDGLRRAFAGAQHRVVQLLPLDAAQQREMVARGCPGAAEVEAFFEGGARPAAGGAGAEPAHAHDDALRLQAAGRQLAGEPQRALPRRAARYARARRHGVQGRPRRAGARAMPAARGIRFARAAAGRAVPHLQGQSATRRSGTRAVSTWRRHCAMAAAAPTMGCRCSSAANGSRSGSRRYFALRGEKLSWYEREGAGGGRARQRMRPGGQRRQRRARRGQEGSFAPL